MINWLHRKKTAEDAARVPAETAILPADAVQGTESAAEKSTQTMAVAEKQTVSPKKTKKRRRLIIAAAVLVLAVLWLALRPRGGAQTAIAYDDTTVLAYGDFSNSVSATGVVESAESTYVYSTLSYAVKSVEVEVGDVVAQGQSLAKLDDQNIVDQIESQQANMSTSAASTAQSIKSAQDNYEQYKYALDNGLNTGLNSAQSQVESAYQNYTKAATTFERYRSSISAGENTALLTQESALSNAEKTLETAEKNHDTARSAANSAYDAWQRALSAQSTLEQQRQALLADADPANDTQLDESVAQAQATASAAKSEYDAKSGLLDNAARALETAQDSYRLAKAQYNAALTTADNSLADYAAAVDTAWEGYQNALTALEAAKLSAQNQLKTYENALASAKTAANNAGARVNLRQLRVDLKQTDITAPCAGTVTAVYAKVGGSGAGLLFVIEDVDDLVVATSVKAYDIGSVSTGMPVTIKSDATGSDVYDGQISSIAPTTAKNAQGQTNTSSDAEFDAEVKVMSAETPLRIGMSVRLNYIIEQQKAVLAVPYDAVYTNADGQQCVLSLDEQTNGKYLLRELAVTTGMENDLDIVVSGEGVSDGLRVVNQPDEYLTMLGREVSLTTASAPEFPMMGQ